MIEGGAFRVEDENDRFARCCDHEAASSLGMRIRLYAAIVKVNLNALRSVPRSFVSRST